MSAYAIPQLAFREDIPTPSARYTRDTVVEQWPQWKDTEDTVLIHGQKVPLVRYPHESEQDAPAVFSNGKGAQEHGWASSELAFLGKAGIPIMVRVFARGRPLDVTFELRSKAGRQIPLRVYLNGDERVRLYRDLATVLAIPESHLEPGVEYIARVSFKINKDPVERSWMFRTR
jgi:hypothetical protein